MLRLPENEYEIGVDEAGRGPLIGRVYAAAVVLDPHKELPPHLNDSKKLTPKRRAELRCWIEQEALAWAVGFSDASEVDKINILQATFRAMQRAIGGVTTKMPEVRRVLVDGHQCPRLATCELVVRCEPKADATWAHVAAASILAKEHHDEHIKALVTTNPSLDTRYGLLSNMGYPTERHRAGLREHGPSEHHRRSFRGVDTTRSDSEHANEIQEQT
jgi:ribonuclease HII